MTPAPLHESHRLQHSADAVQSRLAAWRERHPARSNLLSATLIENLARHAAAQSGAVQQRLHERLLTLITAHDARPDRTAAAAAKLAPHPGVTQPSPARPISSTPPAKATTGLAALTAQLGQSTAPPPSSADRPTATDEALISLGGPPDLKAMGYFRSTWSRLSAERRLTQSLARVPDKAGPLNAQHLVHQTLALMREISPGYLNHFLDHADTLMWLARAQAPRTPETAPTRASTGKAGKPAAKRTVTKRSASR